MVELDKVENEKMVYINERGIPFQEEYLDARIILERAGFSPTEYVLSISRDGKEKLVKNNEERIKIENNMKLTTILKTS